MQARIPVHLEQLVRQLVADGEYASVDQVVTKALEAFAVVKLKADIEVGLKDLREGHESDWDVEEAKRDLLARLKRNRRKAS